MRCQSALLDQSAALPFAGQRVLLTGASGFLGWQVARQGLAAGVAVHCLGRSPGPDGTHHHVADLTDREGVGAAVAAITPHAVIHCAAPGVAYGAIALAEMLAVAVLGVEALLDACARLPAPPQVVLVGSGFEYAPAPHAVTEDWPIVPAGSHYGAAKAASSCVAGAFADRLAMTLLRPFHIYGAGEAERRLGPFIIAQARSGKPVELTACAQIRDFLHVDDCAAMIWAALEATTDAPALTLNNLGCGQPISLRTFVETIVAELAARGVAAECRVGALSYRAAEPMVSLPDISRWQVRDLRKARIALADGVADLVTQELGACA
ncbi:MAG: NAD(P)-dependent oxidoreductase [Pseudomonadota bacterium]|nr:NAD(P)-dependent oxidoreductase [Pseudomonadota bacterium]